MNILPELMIRTKTFRTYTKRKKKKKDRVVLGNPYSKPRDLAQMAAPVDLGHRASSIDRRPFSVPEPLFQNVNFRYISYPHSV